MSRQRAWSIVRDLGQTAGIVGLYPHLLRHGHVSACLAAGLPLRVVATSAGHVDVRTTLRYARALEEIGTTAGDTVLERIGAAGSGELAWNGEQSTRRAPRER